MSATSTTGEVAGAADRPGDGEVAAGEIADRGGDARRLSASMNSGARRQDERGSAPPAPQPDRDLLQHAASLHEFTLIRSEERGENATWSKSSTSGARARKGASRARGAGRRQSRGAGRKRRRERASRLEEERARREHAAHARRTTRRREPRPIAGSCASCAERFTRSGSGGQPGGPGQVSLALNGFHDLSSRRSYFSQRISRSHSTWKYWSKPAESTSRCERTLAAAVMQSLTRSTIMLTDSVAPPPTATRDRRRCAGGRPPGPACRGRSAPGRRARRARRCRRRTPRRP